MFLLKRAVFFLDGYIFSHVFLCWFEYFVGATLRLSNLSSSPISPALRVFFGCSFNQEIFESYQLASTQDHRGKMVQYVLFPSIFSANGQRARHGVTTLHVSGQIIATSHDLAPKGR